MLVEKSELWVYKGKSPSLVPNQPPGLKKRKSKLALQQDKNGNDKDNNDKADSRGSISSIQVNSCLSLTFFLYDVNIMYEAYFWK